MKKTSLMLLTIMLTLMLTSNVMGKKHTDEFYEKTRFIMLKKEIQIYKHLPDQESREAFIEDFWEKRDPSPGTEENENRMEYQRRLAYVDRYFKEKSNKSPGWDSDRGRIYLLLGPPDTRTTRPTAISSKIGSPISVLHEYWIYDYYRLYLIFADENSMGVYRLKTWPTQLLSAIDRAKFTISEKGKEDVDQKFKFKAQFKDDKITIKIPTKSAVFDFEKNKEDVSVRFYVAAYIYRNYKRVDKIETTRQFSAGKDEILKQKDIVLTVPYTPSSKGKYLFDVIVQDENSGPGAKYREIFTSRF